MDAAERKLESVPPPGSEVADAILPFERLSRADVSFAGGKGANLGELTAAGFPVPLGFVIGAPAYATFCEETGLRGEIEVRLSRVEFEDTASLSQAAAEVRALVESKPIPDWLEESIVAAYRRLGGEEEVAVAVRSSATAEDTESASFAGMNETFLNVCDEAGVVEAVRRCWSSLFGARTVFYRAKRGFGQADMDIAVVVQRQIDAIRAGVMFTIDPSSGATDRLVIEGSFGLGEAVVSGSVAPDRYVVDKATLELAAREVRSKELMVKPRPGGGTITRRLPLTQAKLPVLGGE
jgi:pyruvate,water dikinase